MNKNAEIVKEKTDSSLSCAVVESTIRGRHVYHGHYAHVEQGLSVCSLYSGLVLLLTPLNPVSCTRTPSTKSTTGGFPPCLTVE